MITVRNATLTLHVCRAFTITFALKHSRVHSMFPLITALSDLRVYLHLSYEALINNNSSDAIQNSGRPFVWSLQGSVVNIL